MLSDLLLLFCKQQQNVGLNAPSGAGCFLTCPLRTGTVKVIGLNAPCGAGCFLTRRTRLVEDVHEGRLNAPCGAGCFLPPFDPNPDPWEKIVLMHLLVLGTFWQHKNYIPVRGDGLNSPSGAGCFLAVVYSPGEVYMSTS